MEITWQETSPQRDRGREMYYPQVRFSGSQVVNHAASGSIPAWVWLANDAQVLWDITCFTTATSILPPIWESCVVGKQTKN